RHVERVARLDRQVGPTGEALLLVGRLDPLVVVVVRAHVVAERVGAAAYIDVVALQVAGLEDGRAARVLLLDDVLREDLARLRIPPVRDRDPLFRVGEPVRALPDRYAEAWAVARRPALRDDLHDAVGRLRAVQRRCRRTLDDLDALDVVRVDVV